MTLYRGKMLLCFECTLASPEVAHCPCDIVHRCMSISRSDLSHKQSAASASTAPDKSKAIKVTLQYLCSTEDCYSNSIATVINTWLWCHGKGIAKNEHHSHLSVLF
jgi:hypothetical protein